MESVKEMPPSGETLPEPPNAEFPYPRRKGRAKKVVSTETASEAPSSAPVLTQDDLEKTIVGSMSLLAGIFDESFTVLDDKQQPLPHVRTACAQMLPWFQIYGSVLVKAMPWFGLATGALMLLSPAIDPTIEICMGVRKMRFTRQSPGDIYTETFKARNQTVEMRKTGSQK